MYPVSGAALRARCCTWSPMEKPVYFLVAWPPSTAGVHKSEDRHLPHDLRGSLVDVERLGASAVCVDGASGTTVCPLGGPRRGVQRTDRVPWAFAVLGAGPGSPARQEGMAERGFDGKNPRGVRGSWGREH